VQRVLCVSSADKTEKDAASVLTWMATHGAVSAEQLKRFDVSDAEALYSRSLRNGHHLMLGEDLAAVRLIATRGT